MTVGAILLAAGSARRMGEDKLLADLGGQPLVLHALDRIAAAGLPEPVAAIVPGGGLIESLRGRARIVEVPDHALGMGHTLAAAIAVIPDDWTAVIICLGDMPFVSPALLAGLAEQAAADVIVRPWFAGRPGNPVLWGRDYFADLAALTGDAGGKALFARHPPRRFDCTDPGILADIDTPEALAEARRRFG